MVLPTRLWEREELAYSRAKMSIYAGCEIRHLPRKESSSFVVHNYTSRCPPPNKEKRSINFMKVEFYSYLAMH